MEKRMPVKIDGPADYVLKLGWHIFPVYGIVKGKCTCGRAHDRDNQAGKHPIPTNGVKGASNDIVVINQWARAYPDCNWAVACGRVSNIFVVDIDPGKNGFESFSVYESERPEGPLPQTLKAVSGGGGRHLFFSYPENTTLGNKVNWLPGVDIRSDGGYIILYPSYHISGGQYRWSNDEYVNIVQAPADFVAALVASNTSASVRDYSIDIDSILDGVPEGRRDHTLFLAACRMRRQLGDGQRRIIEHIILEAASKCTPPMPEADALRKVEQAFKQDHSDENIEWGFITADGEAFHHLTDRGNKERFVEQLASGIRHVNGWGWIQYSHIGWQRVGDEVPLYAAEGLSTVVREEIPKLDDNVKKKLWTRFALTCEGVSSIRAAVSLAKNDPRLNLSVDDFDRDTTSIACLNGVVDLKTGELSPFSRDLFTTKNTGVMYDPDFILPQWESFLKEATGGDDTLISYLQRAAGYTLTGLTTEECLFILSGPTASGKSTFVDALLAMSGGYGITTQSETFMYRRNNQTAKNELARLAGMRLVAMSEVREGEVFDEGIVKQFTGGDRVSARFLYQDTFEFLPQMKLWIATNHDPAAREDAMMRRIKRIMFPFTVPPERRDFRLKAMLKDPDVGGRALLAWAVKGAIQYLNEGTLNEPLQVSMAIADYKQENDTFAHFLQETLVPQEGSRIPLNTVYFMYRTWCAEMGEYAVKRTQFKKRLVDTGYTIVKHGPDIAVMNNALKTVMGVVS